MTEQLAESALLKLISRWVVVAIAGGLSWVVLLLLEIDKRDILQTERIENILEKVEYLSEEMDERQLEIYKRIDDKAADRYTGSDARVDRAKQDTIDKIQNTAIQRLLDRVDKLESQDDSNFPPRWPGGYDPK
jgi:hypothetical protein